MSTIGEKFDPYTGRDVALDSTGTATRAVSLGLEPPRFCADCGRRMVVQIMPNGWTSSCSRHGIVDSTSLGQR